MELPMHHAGLFGLSDHLKRLSAYGDPLEELERIIDFEAFRPTLIAALAYGDGARGGRPPYVPVLRDVVTNDNTASDVWADTAYRSQANEKWLKRQGRVSRIHRRKPRGKPMPERTAKANAAKSKVPARVEHVFAQQKDKMGLFIRTIGIKRAEAKITLANLAYNMNRLIFHERRATMG